MRFISFLGQARLGVIPVASEEAISIPVDNVVTVWQPAAIESHLVVRERTATLAEFFFDLSTVNESELIPLAGNRKAGDFYGASVAISGDKVFVGAPLNDDFGPNQGSAHIFRVNSDGTVAPSVSFNTAAGSNSQFGSSIATDGNTIVVGAPAVGAGEAFVSPLTSDGEPLLVPMIRLQRSDGAAGDQFGNSVAISGNTAVISAGGDDEKGTDAGAGLRLRARRQWTMEPAAKAHGQRRHAGDLFSY